MQSLGTQTGLPWVEWGEKWVPKWEEVSCMQSEKSCLQLCLLALLPL
jgi:hypothetical protein